MGINDTAKRDRSLDMGGCQTLAQDAFLAVDEHDGSLARQAVRHQLAIYLTRRPNSALTRAKRIVAELSMLAASGAAAVEAGMPDDWVDELAIAGTPSECADKLLRLHAAGADSAP